VGLPAINVLSLCSGVGGLDLGIKLAIPTARTVCYVEREAYCCEVLATRMEEGSLAPAPVWTDLATFDGRPWRGRVDLVVAGFPCQPFSTASRGRPVVVDLWAEVARVVREAEPSWVFLENVCRAPWAMVAADLQLLGFHHERAEVDVADLGGPHRRRRSFLLAHTDGEGEPRGSFDAEVAGIPPDAGSGRAANPGPVGVDARAPSRVDRLRACGNGVVPLVAAHAFRTLASKLKETR